MNFEEMLETTVRVAMREEVKNAMRELIAELRPQTGETLTPIEAGAIAKVHPETIRQWCREKRLPSLKAGREYRIKREDLYAYLARSDSPASNDPEAAAAAILAKTRGKR